MDVFLGPCWGLNLANGARKSRHRIKLDDPSTMLMNTGVNHTCVPIMDIGLYDWPDNQSTNACCTQGNGLAQNGQHRGQNRGLGGWGLKQNHQCQLSGM